MAPIIRVFGIYQSRSAVEAAVRGFKDAGLPSSGISLVMPESRAFQEMITKNDTKAPQSATDVRSVVEGALGWLTGVGALTLPRLGPVIVAGPLVPAFAGGQSNFSESLSALGVPEIQASGYQQRLRGGGVLAVIHCQTVEQFQQAREIMEITCAEEITSTGNSFSERTSSAA